MCEIVNLGNGATAFVCNCKTNHECNDDKTILILSDGNRVPDTHDNQKKYRNQIVGGSVCCSICNKAAIDSAPYF